jgi:hypothetical protein
MAERVRVAVRPAVAVQSEPQREYADHALGLHPRAHITPEPVLQTLQILTPA